MVLLVLDALSLLAFAAAIGIIIFAFKGKIRFFRGVVATTGGLLLSSIISIYRANLASGTNIITTAIDETFSMFNSVINSMSLEQIQHLFGNITGDSANSIKEAVIRNILSVKEIYIVMFPSILILNTLLISYLTYMITKQIVSIFKKDVSLYPKFSELMLSRSATAAFVVSYILPYIVSNNTVSAAITNISFIIGGVAAVCGLSYIDYKIRFKIKFSWFRLIIYIALFFITSAGVPIVVFALILVAIADSFKDFRGLRRREVQSNG